MTGWHTAGERATPPGMRRLFLLPGSRELTGPSTGRSVAGAEHEGRFANRVSAKLAAVECAGHRHRCLRHRPR